MAAPAQKENKVPVKNAAQASKEEIVVDTSLPRYETEKDLFTWKAPSRPFKKRSREYWVTLFSIAALLAFILFLAEGVMPVILIISVVFLFYVLSTIEPEVIEYKITTHGIKIAEKTTFWNALIRYWFTDRLDSELLIFEAFVFPGRLELVVNSKDINSIRKTLQKFLPEEKPEETSVDKATNWISKKLPN